MMSCARKANCCSEGARFAADKDFANTSESEASSGFETRDSDSDVNDSSVGSEVQRHMTVNGSANSFSSESDTEVATTDEENDHLSPLRKLKMLRSSARSVQGEMKSGLKSFSISDILSYSPNCSQRTEANSKIVRPWDLDSGPFSKKKSRSLEEPQVKINKYKGQDSKGKLVYSSSPLDALFQMTNKTFEGLKKECVDSTKEHLGMFENRQHPKKKRKSRTAFTNHQVFELEKRFLYQKYLTPADRDDIAANLGLSKAQVITWFQNRRAKLKRDMEELKKDVQTAAFISNQKTYIESIRNLNFSKELEWASVKISCEQLECESAADDTSISPSSAVIPN